MPIIATAEQGFDFTPASEGIHRAVCCDVVDLGMKEMTFKGETKKRHRVTIYWQIDEERDDGSPHEMRQEYTLSLYDRAQLRGMIELWRGRKFSPEELESFDLETLIGKPCQIQIMHNVDSRGRTWANVKGVFASPKGSPPLEISEGYLRHADRPDRNQGDPGATTSHPDDELVDMDGKPIPF